MEYPLLVHHTFPPLYFCNILIRYYQEVKSVLGPDQVNHLARFLEQLAIGAKCRMPNAFLALPLVIF